MTTFEPIDELVENIDSRLKKADEPVYAESEGLRELVERYEELKKLVPESDTAEITPVEVYEGRFLNYSERDFRLIDLIRFIYKIDEALIEVSL